MITSIDTKETPQNTIPNTDATASGAVEYPKIPSIENKKNFKKNDRFRSCSQKKHCTDGRFLLQWYLT